MTLTKKQIQNRLIKAMSITHKDFNTDSIAVATSCGSGEVWLRTSSGEPCKPTNNPTDIAAELKTRGFHSSFTATQSLADDTWAMSAFTTALEDIINEKKGLED